MRYNGGRRTYSRLLNCQDCGRAGATLAHFWVNGMPYRVCSVCIRPYRPVLLYPCRAGCAHDRRPEPAKVTA